MTDKPIKTTDDIIDAMMYSIEHAKITRGCSRDGETFYTTLTVNEQNSSVQEKGAKTKEELVDQDF